MTGISEQREETQLVCIRANPVMQYNDLKIICRKSFKFKSFNQIKKRPLTHKL